MVFNFNVFTLVLVLSALINLFFALLVLRRPGPAVKWFGALMIALSIWTITYGFELSSVELNQMLFWTDLQYIGIALIPACWIIFILKFVGKDKWLTRIHYAAIFTIPFFTLLLVWTNHWHHLHYTTVTVDSSGPFPMMAFDVGPMYIIHTIYFYVLLAGGLFMLFNAFRRADKVYRRQNRIILYGALIPWLANVAYLFGFRPFNHIDITPFAFIVTTITISYGILRLRLFDIIPIARERVIASMPDGVMVLDVKDRIIDLNVAMRNLLINRKDIVIGLKVEDIFPLQQELLQAIKERANKRIEFSLLKNESIQFLSINITPLLDKGSIYGGVLLVFTDITDRKNAEEALIYAKEEAEQAAIVKSRFLSTMSHEIRTPMNAVIGFTHLLLQNNPRPDQVEHLNILKYSSENLLALINDILDLNKIESGKVEFEEIDFNLKTLTGNIKAALQPRADEKSLYIKVRLANNIPEIVAGDPLRLGQVLTNLMSNAVKFTDKGGVLLSVTLLEKEATRFCLNFDIMDSGIGIDPSKQQAIFEQFTQAEKETSRNFGGTGLGLTISKRLLELQESHIKVVSEPGKGSTFNFKLWFKNPKSSIAKPFSDVPETVSLKGIRVLIAEDNPINTLLAQQILKLWEVEADTAENGEIAVQLVKENEYDMVFMDLQMPVMDGYEATLAIRNLTEDKYRNIPVIALTASAIHEVKERSFLAGITDYISKPFNPSELYEKLVAYKKVTVS